MQDAECIAEKVRVNRTEGITQLTKSRELTTIRGTPNRAAWYAWAEGWHTVPYKLVILQQLKLFKTVLLCVV